MLFEPYKLKNITLRNRVAMAPMTRSQSPGGIPTNDVVEYYKRRAKAEVGLIITEGVEVSHEASSAYPNVPRLDSKEARDGWKKVVDGIKENNGHVVAQLWHCGGFRKLGMGPNPEVPGHTASGLVRPGKRVAHAMTSLDIEETVNAYASDAKICEEIGFDGVEIHGAHGYLIDNFLWNGTNDRDDRFGGSIETRSNLATSITKAIRNNVSDKFIVGLRFSQWKQQDYTARLATNPDDLLKVLSGPCDAAYWTKKLTNIPTMSVGSVGLDGDFTDMMASAKTASIDKALKDINEQKYDMVAVGRALLSDHEWVIKMKEGRLKDINPYTKESLLEMY